MQSHFNPLTFGLEFVGQIEQVPFPTNPKLLLHYWLLKHCLGQLDVDLRVKGLQINKLTAWFVNISDLKLFLSSITWSKPENKKL